MTQQEDPARQESDRLAQGEATELPAYDGASEKIEDGASEDIDAGPADASRPASGSPDDPSEASRRGMPGYQ